MPQPSLEKVLLCTDIVQFRHLTLYHNDTSSIDTDDRDHPNCWPLPVL